MHFDPKLLSVLCHNIHNCELAHNVTTVGEKFITIKFNLDRPVSLPRVRRAERGPLISHKLDTAW